MGGSNRPLRAQPVARQAGDRVEVFEVQMHEVIRRRREELDLTQAELAARVGVDRRQIRRYESGETYPNLPAAKQLAAALGISLDELAGGTTRRVDLTGDWWACWQTWKDGIQVLNPHEVRMSQRGDVVTIAATSRGTPVQDGGYLWNGEMRIFDNEAAIGWYVANEGAIRSKGSLYFTLHQHGVQALGRWVGLSYDGPIISGWSALARTHDEVVALVEQLIAGKPTPAIGAASASDGIPDTTDADGANTDVDGEED